MVVDSWHSIIRTTVVLLCITMLPSVCIGQIDSDVTDSNIVVCPLDKSRYYPFEDGFFMITITNRLSEPVDYRYRPDTAISSTWGMGIILERIDTAETFDAYHLQCSGCIGYQDYLLPGEISRRKIIFTLEEPTLPGISMPERKEINPGLYRIKLPLTVSVGQQKFDLDIRSETITVGTVSEVNRKPDTLFAWNQRFGNQKREDWCEAYEKIENMHFEEPYRNTIVYKRYRLPYILKGKGNRDEWYNRDLQNYLINHPDEQLAIVVLYNYPREFLKEMYPEIVQATPPGTKVNAYFRKLFDAP